jgi:hypothetical protein
VAAEYVPVRHPLLLNCVLERARNVFLTDYIGEALRPILTRQDLIAHEKFDYT